MTPLEVTDSESLLYASMEHSPIGMALTRMDGSWIDVNPALCDILGYSKSELMVAGFKQVTLPEDREATVQTARALVASGQKSVRLEKRYIHSSGRIVEAVLYLTVVRDAANKPTMYISQITDVTAARQLEYLKSEFIRTVNHELRTPLTGIMGALKLLEATTAKDLPETAQNLLNIAWRNSGRLKSLLDDILEMEQVVVDQSLGEPEEVDLAEVVKAAVAAVHERSEAAAIPVRDVSDAASVICQTHSQRLLRVLQILLSNAIKYSDPSGEVTVRLERLDRTARVSVRNTGLPIPGAMRDHIFQPFVLGEPSDTRRKQGGGLGLAIAHNLTTSIGGRIDFTSDDAETRFWVDIPS
ncbi:PAS domain S-box protein [Roseibacterium sp. SDUM158017]|uniref:sensor histidine kinase n=1 Tax=Roseicyclus salinarum TaxID=3036773 RepID=UPI0024152860|nr:sensor histidine kinase [Roseibacterium sp. SDUM158017]MDG4648722.1 PAS domain S-box protein [Roseibacterium sp. SDUM158017]